MYYEKAKVGVWAEVDSLACVSYLATVGWAKRCVGERKRNRVIRRGAVRRVARRRSRVSPSSGGCLSSFPFDPRDFFYLCGNRRALPPCHLGDGVEAVGRMRRMLVWLESVRVAHVSGCVRSRDRKRRSYTSVKLADWSFDGGGLEGLLPNLVASPSRRSCDGA